jgi:hypothetical protein
VPAGIGQSLRAAERPPAAGESWRTRVASLRRLLTPAVGAGAAVLVFAAISVWWVSVETRVPDFDNGKHLGIAFTYHDAFRDGDLLAPFTEFNTYPPLVHIVGALAALIGGVGVVAPVTAQNLVFMPLLALGCYGAGKVAFDARVGALAAVFALGAPMVISQFHVFMLDAPTAALVAVSVWLILASDRFARRGYALAAGVAVGLGVITKNTFPLFIAGLVLVALVRGGWRNWRNVIVSGAAAALIAVPWLAMHAGELEGLTGGAVGDTAGAGMWWSNIPYPERWTLTDFAWYGWNLVNNQLYLPLTAFFLIGVAVAAYGWIRKRAGDDLTPELLVGGFVGYFLIALIALNDPRYTLPCLVYVAVLGTAWIVRLSVPWRWAAASLLVGIVVLNTVMVSFGAGPTVRADYFNGPPSPIRERQFTVVSPAGFVEGGPVTDEHVLDLLRAAKEQGARRVYFGGDLNYTFFNGAGLAVFLREAGMDLPYGNDPKNLGERDVSLVRRFAEPGDPLPCIRLRDGSSVYVLNGSFSLKPEFDDYERLLGCPYRSL